MFNRLQPQLNVGFQTSENPRVCNRVCFVYKTFLYYLNLSVNKIQQLSDIILRNRTKQTYDISDTWIQGDGIAADFFLIMILSILTILKQ